MKEELFSWGRIISCDTTEVKITYLNHDPKDPVDENTEIEIKITPKKPYVLTDANQPDGTHIYIRKIGDI